MDDDGDDDAPVSGPPLPPDDRLWRHPSELGGKPRAAPPPLPPLLPPAAAPPAARSRARSVVLIAGTVGATLTVGILALVQGLPRTLNEGPGSTAAAATVAQAFAGTRIETIRATTRVAQAIAQVEATTDGATALGSAVVVRADGYLVTAAHLVVAAQTIRVVTADGRSHRAAVVGTDPVTDIAVLQIAAKELPTAVLDTDGEVSIGDTTIAVGCPTGAGGRPWVEEGTVRGLRRSLDGAEGQTLHGLIETDTPVAPSAAGGALVDGQGRVVGISTTTTDDQAAGFATPARMAVAVADEIIATGTAHHVWLGIEGDDLDAAGVKALGVDGGAVVHRVVDGSPAAAAGLREGDVIVAVNAAPVASMSELVGVVRDHEHGDDVEITYLRDGDETTQTVKLIEK